MTKDESRRKPSSGSRDDERVSMKALAWAYDLAVEGSGRLHSAEQLAAPFTARTGTRIQHSNALIRWQIAKASASGFFSGLEGLVTAPIAVPANIASVLFVQLRMVAAIAHIGGHDVRDEQVRSFAYLCLCGSVAVDVAKDLGMKVGLRMTQAAVGRMSGAALVRFNQKVGFNLASRIGGKGAINLGLAFPLAGGVINGFFDGVTTNVVGNVARKHFVEPG
ncbi:MAG: hypothetical protein RLZZ450_221 [Pseudomonadota bacterium]|jgi:hypothetical protein